MKSWEYKVVLAETDRYREENTLLRLGLEGWELVSVYSNHMYLKRPLSKIGTRIDDAGCGGTWADLPLPTQLAQ